MPHILLIEPDATTATLISKAFESRSFKIDVIKASTAQEAVSFADQNKPDLVILELALKEHNGLAFLHEFRSYPDWVSVPVIIHTHLARSADILKNQIDNLSVKKYLYKPTTSLSRLVDDCAELLAV